MVSNKTYNNVINTLLRLAEYHKQIESTSVGDIFDINMVTEKANWTTNRGEIISISGDEFTKLVKTLSNEQDVYNETLQICTDFIGMLRHSTRQSIEGVNDINFPLYFTQDQFTIEPFSERFDNLCCGFVFNIGILVQNDFQTCDIPVNTRGAGY